MISFGSKSAHRHRDAAGVLRHNRRTILTHLLVTAGSSKVDEVGFFRLEVRRRIVKSDMAISPMPTNRRQSVSFNPRPGWTAASDYYRRQASDIA